MDNTRGLFRGKRTDNGVWQFGYHVPYMNRSYIYFEEQDEFCQTGSFLDRVLVDQDTVGRYTGLTDKNGKMIFEGDIVRYSDTVHEVVYESRFRTAYFGIVMGPMETWPFGTSVPADKMEIIGNIRDNPELMGGQDG